MAEEGKLLTAMSAPAAAGGPFSKYMDDSILNPLISRLDFMLTGGDHLRPSDPDSVALLKEITGFMRGLQALFRKIGEEEQVLIKLFDPVEKLLDGVFEFTSASEPQILELRHKLGAVRTELVGIRETIIWPCKIEGHFGGGGGEEDEHPAPVTQVRAIRDCEEMAHLRRAVNGMDLPLKNCLLCLAAFPEGAHIKKRLLIHWWIGEGFVPSVIKGKELFNNLVCLKFVLIHRDPQQKAHQPRLYTVHPWIHRMLVSVAKTAAFLEIDSDGNCSNDFERTRRACLRKGKMIPSGSIFHQKVSAIYNIDQSYVKLSTGWFTNKTCLRTVQLGQWRVFGPTDMAADAKTFHVELINEEHLKGIEACKNLRYLSLRGISGIKAIPDAVGNLSGLIVLDLRACHNLQVLTKEITKLHNLEYLDVSECYLLVEMPEGLGKLSSLEVLKGFVVASSSRNNSCRLAELVSLKKLRKLSISIGKKTRLRQDEYKIFAELDSLKSLRITWGWGVIPSKDTPIAESTKFSLPCDLEKLDLQCFPFENFPDLFTAAGLSVLKSVQKLYVTGGMLKNLEPLNQERDCQRLRLKFVKHLQKNDRTNVKVVDLMLDQENKPK